MLYMVFDQILTSCNHNPRRIRKVDRDFVREVDFKEIKFPVKITDIHKVEKKKNCIEGFSVFDYEIRKNILQFMRQEILSKDMLINYK